MSQQVININDSIKTFQEKFNVLSANLGDIDLTGLVATDVSAAIRELAVNLASTGNLADQHDSELGTISAAVMGTAAGTVGGAIAELDSDRDRLVSLVGPTTALDTTATTVTTAINELVDEIDQLNAATVTAGDYGTASLIPTLTVNSRGQITAIGTAAVAGVTSFGYNTSTGVITIGTADGGSHPATITLAPFSTSNLTEGTNQYFTTARARASVSGNNGITYNSTTGVIGCTLRIYDVNGAQIWP